MTLRRIEAGALGANAWVISDSGQCLVIDPGGEDAPLLEASLGAGIQCTGVFLTHGHADHIAGLKPYIEREIPIYIGAEDCAALTDARVNLSVWLGIPLAFADCPHRVLGDGGELTLGEISFRVIAAPGHSPGSLCLYGGGHLFTGDVLFAGGGVGRTDFPGGDAARLALSIREKLFVLPDETAVHPGHGGDTTIGAEKKYHFY